MKTIGFRRWLLVALALVVVAPLAVAPRPVVAQEGPGMPSFSSDAELRRFLKVSDDYESGIVPPPPPPPPPPPAAPPPPSPGAPAPAPAAPGAKPDNPSITSTQVVGVDEGGIVKVAGDYLVILRRGRLFSVSTADGGLRAVDHIDAYAPGLNPRWDWYDEMLIKGDLIVVVGFSYDRGGTEVNRFRIAADGKLSFVDAHHIRSDDYFSSRNYASRLIGDQLIVYSPLDLVYDDEQDPLDALPGMRRWTGDEKAPWVRTAGARQVYIPEPLKRARGFGVETLHTVTRCDLAAPEVTCASTVVMGPRGRTFFVSRNAIYIWVTPAWSTRDWDAREAYLYRIPFDRTRPAAVRVRGGPVDQFSFNANERLGRLEVLVTSRSGGDAMWAPEFAHGRPALLTLPTSRFGDGSREAPKSDYRMLPGGGDDVNVSHNRFVGDHLLYSLYGVSRGEPEHKAVAVPVDGADPVVFDLPWRVTRIEQVGRDALVVGGTEEAVFQTIDLAPGRVPGFGDRFVQPNSREAESRSQAFFYRADSADGQTGIMGLPVLRLGGTQWLADMLFLRRTDAKLSDFGLLRASAPSTREDGCVASCVDWYGNARPIFMRGRVFALLGYELVEGDASGERIRELRRVSFAPEAER